jgi:carbamoyltransferase
MLKLNKTRDERESYTATRAYLDEHLIPRRAPADPVTHDHEDVAAALQECLDKAILHVCGHFGEKTGLRRIALAGGVALNCTANGKLMRSGLFDEVYVQPVAGDDGVALGAALLSQLACGGGSQPQAAGSALWAALLQRAILRPR